MNFILKAEELNSIMSMAGDVIASIKRDTTIEGLSRVKFVISQNTKSKLIINSREMYFEHTIDIDEASEAADCILDLLSIVDLVKQLKGSLSITTKGDKAIIKTKTGEYKVPYYTSENYVSTINQEAEYVIAGTAKNLNKADQVMLFIGETNNLEGMLLETESDSINLVGTDGYSLAKTIIPFVRNESFTENLYLPVPKLSVPFFKKIKPDQEVNIAFVGKSLLKLYTDDWVFVTRLNSNKFVDYKRVMDFKNISTCGMNKSDLIERLNNIKPINESGIFYLNFEGEKFTISGKGDIADAELTAPITTMSTEPLNIKVNISYLYKITKSLIEEKILIHKTDQQAVIFQGESKQDLFFLMPMKEEKKDV